jgi:hypothetical protein
MARMHAGALHEEKYQQLLAQQRDDTYRVEAVKQALETKRLEKHAQNVLAQQHARALVNTTAAQRADRLTQLYHSSIASVDAGVTRAAAASQARAMTAGAAAARAMAAAKARQEELSLQRDAQRAVMAAQERQREVAARASCALAAESRNVRATGYLLVAQRVRGSRQDMLTARRETLEQKREAEHIHAQAVAAAKSNALEVKRQEKRLHWDEARARAQVAIRQRAVRRAEFLGHFEGTLQQGSAARELNRKVPLSFRAQHFDPAAP